jgi:hypothetical protein
VAQPNYFWISFVIDSQDAKVDLCKS